VDLVVFQRGRTTLNPADPLAVAGVLLVLAGLLIRSWAAGAPQVQAAHHDRAVCSGRNPLHVARS
jgi:hypothetical protein